MIKTNRYVQCLVISIYTMKIFGIFPFIFSHRETLRITTILQISITVFSIVLYILVLIQETFYIFTTIDLLAEEFHFIILVRFVFCMSTRLLVISVPVMTWRNSEKLYTFWRKWENYEKEIDEINRARFVIPSNIFRIIPLVFILISFLPLPVKSYFNNYEQFAANLYSFYYLGIVLSSIISYWLINCLFFIFLAKEVQRLIEKAIRHEEYMIILRLLVLWYNLFEWKKEFISAHSNLFLIFIIESIMTFVTSVYSMIYTILFEMEKLTSILYLLSASFAFLTLLTFTESTNYLYTQMVVRIQQILLSENITKSDVQFLKQVETFYLAIEVHKTKPTLNEVITLKRSTIIAILVVIINYLIVLKQIHY